MSQRILGVVQKITNKECVDGERYWQELLRLIEIYKHQISTNYYLMEEILRFHTSNQYGLKILQIFIDNGISMNLVKGKTLKTNLLHQAIEFDVDHQIIDLMIKNDADITFKKDNSFEPIHTAVMFKRKEILKVLINNGADVNARTSSRLTPLHFAKDIPDLEIWRILIVNGGNMFNKANNFNNIHPFLHMLRNKLFEIEDVIDLLNITNKICDINILHELCTINMKLLDFETISFFIKHVINNMDIDINSKNSNGHTIIHTMVLKKCLTTYLLLFLLDLGLDINSQTPEGYTALHLLLKEKTIKMDCIKTLLDLGIDYNVIDNNNYPALYYAENYSNFLAVHKMILEKKIQNNNTKFKNIKIFQKTTL